jgi:hypothetical protein
LYSSRCDACAAALLKHFMEKNLPRTWFQQCWPAWRGRRVRRIRYFVGRLLERTLANARRLSQKSEVSSFTRMASK